VEEVENIQAVTIARIWLG